MRCDSRRLSFACISLPHFSAVGQPSYCRLLQRDGDHETRIASRSVRNEQPLIRCDSRWLGFHASHYLLFSGRTGFLLPPTANSAGKFGIALRSVGIVSRSVMNDGLLMRCDSRRLGFAATLLLTFRASYCQLKIFFALSKE